MNGRMLVRVPATTANLGPGFDSLGMALELWNQFEATVTQSRSRTVVIRTSQCEGEGSETLSLGEGSLVHRSIMRAIDEGGGAEDFPGVLIDLKAINRVPLASGLGSSATAIVAGLLIGNELRQNKLSLDQLIALATEIEGHPDNVTAALLGGFCISVVTADGEVHTLSLAPPKNLCVVMAVPLFHLGTDSGRAVLPASVSREDAIYNLSRTALLVGSIAAGRLDLLKVATEDALHQPYRSHRVPGFTDVVEKAIQAGAVGVALSGSGPSVAAFCDVAPEGDCLNADDQDVTSRVRRAMEDAFGQAGVNARSFRLRPDTKGASISFDVKGQTGDEASPYKSHYAGGI